MRCRVHGVTVAAFTDQIVTGSDGEEETKPIARCIECQRAATRRSRMRRTIHPNASPGSYFNGLRTMHGHDITKRQVPFLETSWQWLKDADNQARHNATGSLLFNKALKLGIAALDPSFDPELED
jgi:hypothetical protein